MIIFMFKLLDSCGNTTHQSYLALSAVILSLFNLFLSVMPLGGFCMIVISKVSFYHRNKQFACSLQYSTINISYILSIFLFMYIV